MTHDLLKLVVEALGASVDRVVVTELAGGTYFADLVMRRNGEEVHLSARPSDAVALAARTATPLFASRAVLDEVGVEIQDSVLGDETRNWARTRSSASASSSPTSSPRTSTRQPGLSRLTRRIEVVVPNPARERACHIHRGLLTTRRGGR